MITKHKELTLFEYGEIISAWKSEISKRKIGNILNFPQSIVHDVIKAYRNFDQEIPSPRIGKLSILTKRNNHYLLKLHHYFLKTIQLYYF